jgi:hypothetical protein
VGAEPDVILQLDAFRKKRNIGGYERAGLVSSTEADEMLDLARKIRDQVEQCIRERQPELLDG